MLRRKRKASNRRRREPLAHRARRRFVRSAKLLALIAAVGTLGYSGRWLYTTLMHTERLAVRTFDVSGNVHVEDREVIMLSGIEEGQNILSFDADEAAERIKENPWVDDVKVSRGVPDTVRFEVTERRPLALVKKDDLYVMDRSGVVFKKFTVVDRVDVPVVTGLTEEILSGDDHRLEEGLIALLSMLDGGEGLALSHVSEIHVDPMYGYTLYTLREGVRVELGFGDFEKKFSAFEKVVNLRGDTLAGIEAVDLNNYREVVVRFTPQAARGGGRA
ncbi:MAG TPA: FtsQ-type POTRA domain-containing protein [Thermodesulfobacteriota bacterium]|nr:FtsQ-type POTRA domain-containing protein [Thermodesulfobacteriota bacterium]